MIHNDGRSRLGGSLQVLQIPSRELSMRNDLNFPVPLLGDRNRVAQITNAVVNLYLLMQEFLKGRDVEDLV